jgi:hypothetical protein
MNDPRIRVDLVRTEHDHDVVDRARADLLEDSR